jgi:predicted transposase YbfD/YdcC
MDAPATAAIVRALETMPDPRHHNIRHKLVDILTIALMAVICGADGWVDVERYARSKQAWLKTFLDLPYGIPSHDTFGSVFARLNPDALERCFGMWMNSMVQLSAGKLVAIDGKSLRRSFEHSWDKSGMSHMVSAFVEANRLVLAQVQTEGKGKELSGIEHLLELLDLNGAVVSIDALGCQKEIARRILDAGGQYLLAVKENQPTLLAKLQVTLDEAIGDGFKGMSHDYDQQTDGDHGRIETRKLWVCWDVELLGALTEQWPGLKTMVAIDRTREHNGQSSTQRHYYISSLDKRTKAPRLAGYVRGHWSVENNLHWQLDISFREDERRIRIDHGAENYSRMCRMALNLLKKETTAKVGMAAKRKMCGWDNDYLLKVMLA